MLKILVFHVLRQRLQQVVHIMHLSAEKPCTKCGDLTRDASQKKEIFSLFGAISCIATSVSPPCGARKIDHHTPTSKYLKEVTLFTCQITTVFTQLCGSIQVFDVKLSYWAWSEFS